MKKLLLTCALAALAGFVACGENPSPNDGGTGGGTGGGTATGGGTGTNDFSTSARIMAHLEGKTMVMAGNDIPSHPNGFSENVDFGANTQCYNEVSIATLAGAFTTTSKLGILNKPDGGSVGVCDRTMTSNTVSFPSTAVLIENVANNGECFDINITYSSFSQQGRGSISADGKTVTLELFFAAAGHRCADGAVGSATVKLSAGGQTVDFTGNAKQVYRIP